MIHYVTLGGLNYHVLKRKSKAFDLETTLTYYTITDLNDPKKLNNNAKITTVTVCNTLVILVTSFSDLIT